MTQYQIDDLAKQQLRDYRSINPGTLFQEGAVKLNIVDAYALQDAVTRLRTMDHERVIGFKVGCTGPGTTKLFGIEGPIRGTLFENEVQPNGASLDSSSFFNLAVEAEMAIEIGTNNNISAVFPIIELHISNIYNREEFRHKSLISKVARGVICGFGADGYIMALNAMKQFFNNEN